MVKKYPQFKIVNFDKLDCKCYDEIIPDFCFCLILSSSMTDQESFPSPLTDCSCLENLDEIKDYPNYKFVKGNICSSELVSYVLEAEKIDTIMHFAAQTHVDNSFGNSFQFTQVTISGKKHFLVHVTTSILLRNFVITQPINGDYDFHRRTISWAHTCCSSQLR